MKESDAQRPRKRGFFEKHVFPFVGTGVRTRERGTYVEEKK